MKHNVYSEEVQTFPFIDVEIQGVNKPWTFHLRKLDAFDEAHAADVARKTCDRYLGVPTKFDKKTGEVLERDRPRDIFPYAGRPVRLSSALIGLATSIAVMQDWEHREQDCYQPEEIINIAAVDKSVWDQLVEKAGEINESPSGNALQEVAEDLSERPSSF